MYVRYIAYFALSIAALAGLSSFFIDVGVYVVLLSLTFFGMLGLKYLQEKKEIETRGGVLSLLPIRFIAVAFILQMIVFVKRYAFDFVHDFRYETLSGSGVPDFLGKLVYVFSDTGSSIDWVCLTVVVVVIILFFASYTELSDVDFDVSDISLTTFVIGALIAVIMSGEAFNPNNDRTYYHSDLKLNADLVSGVEDSCSDAREIVYKNWSISCDNHDIGGIKSTKDISTELKTDFKNLGLDVQSRFGVHFVFKDAGKFDDYLAFISLEDRDAPPSGSPSDLESLLNDFTSELNAIVLSKIKHEVERKEQAPNWEMRKANL
ncbi:hypothetical protein QX249_08780 [Vibrio parahaemolyticus]|uniref:Uncharacterized protein n=1 Tax=Vibrio parahaemolyticus TaxID=670 RepID=A0AAW8PWZ4_VIBPH|nr:hypothetical protein [Vibrio parahaemolyticus]MDS1820752.1 hypothetical protein [Vibrio parahaemolyticus]